MGSTDEDNSMPRHIIMLQSEPDMPHPKLPVEGHCMCGESRMHISIAPIITMACHCRGCQQMSASAFSLNILVPADGFAVTQGTPQIGALHGQNRYLYCPRCLNWLYTAPAGMPFVNVRPVLFDVPLWRIPFAETCVDEKLPWATTPAQHSFAQYPPPEQYASLMAAYSEWVEAQ
jgi:hypothetical protein